MACIIEIVVGNFSALKTIGLTPTILQKNEETNAQGIYETQPILLSQDVRNLYIDLELYHTQTADVIVSLTDEGDEYAYDLPQITIVPTVPSTCYINLYPYGDVKDIKVKVSVEEGTVAKINSISVNVPKPFSFKFFRFLILLVFMTLVYMIGGKSHIHNIFCERNNVKQVRTIIVMSTLVIMLGFALVRINPACLNPYWPHHKQYQELAKSLVDGKVALPYKPTDELLQVKNPYDTSALMVKNIEYRMDYAFYQGKYYVYFGIIPEILFFLPFYLLTGKELPNYLVVFVLYSGFVLVSFACYGK